MWWEAQESGALVRRHAKALPIGVACVCAVGLAAFLGSGAPAAGAASGAFPGQGFLPENRAWELVSPPDKNGGNILAETTHTRVAAAGDAVQFVSASAFADAVGSPLGVEYIARRDATPGTQGWSTHSITPFMQPNSVEDAVFSREPFYVGDLSPDLSTGVFITKENLAPGSGNVAELVKLYLRRDLLTPGPGTYELLSDCAAPPAGPCASPLHDELLGAPQPGFAGASADFSHVIFQSTYALTGDATDNGESKLYEFEDDGVGSPTLRLAGVLPDSACGSPPCPATSSAAGQSTGTDPNGRWYTPNTISADGSRVLFTSPVNKEGRETAESQLYLRENHTTTVQVSEPELETSFPAPAKYWAASADLSKIFFTAGGQLYRYDATLPASDPHNLTRLSVDNEADDGSGAVEGVIGASEDGDYVYFFNQNQLVDDGIGGTTVHRCTNRTMCIFVWHDGVVGEVGPYESGGRGVSRIIGEEGYADANPAKPARVTPDGAGLVFISDGLTKAGEASLDEAAGVPGYDHGENCSVGFYFTGEPPCAEIYVYNATANGGAGRLSCASCNPSGIHQSATDAGFFKDEFVDKTSYLNHVISDDGRLVFFSTEEALVPADTNGQIDVYSYDTETAEQHLISSGESPQGSYFMDATTDGSEVFFVTRERLTGWDRDNLTDLYSARIDGGIPDPPPPPAACEGDACQPPPVLPNDQTPASSGFAGAGNRGTARPRCPRGKRRVRANGRVRCVKAKHHHRRHTTRSHG